MTVPNRKYPAPLSLHLTLDEQVRSLIDRVLEATTIEQDDESAKALIALMDVVAGEENSDTRKMIALDVAAAVYAKTGAFYAAVKSFAASGRSQYLTIPDSSRRTRGNHVSQAV